MLQFALKSPSSFHRQKFEYPCLFATQKIVGSIMCLLVNVTILARSETIEDVIKDYVCVLIISQIDDAMSTTFNPPNIERNIFMHEKQFRESNWKMWKRYGLCGSCGKKEDENCEYKQAITSGKFEPK